MRSVMTGALGFRLLRVNCGSHYGATGMRGDGVGHFDFQHGPIIFGRGTFSGQRAAVAFLTAAGFAGGGISD